MAACQVEESLESRKTEEGEGCRTNSKEVILRRKINSRKRCAGLMKFFTLGSQVNTQKARQSHSMKPEMEKMKKQAPLEHSSPDQLENPVEVPQMILS